MQKHDWLSLATAETLVSMHRLCFFMPRFKFSCLSLDNKYEFLDPAPTFVLDRLRADMRVDEQYRKTVVFVGIEANHNFVPLGTGFIINANMDEHAFYFLVTASHVLDLIQSDEFSIRINRKSGPAESMKLNRLKAIRHKKLNNDIALFNIGLDFTIYDSLALPLHRGTLEMNRRDLWDVRIGDEVCAIGLYTSHYGLTKNIPVTRFGNLAALPEEPVRGPKGYVPAYLIELRTIAGISGSPVFVLPPSIRFRNGALSHKAFDSALPLGMLVCYHVVESSEDQVKVPRLQEPERDEHGDDRPKEYSLDERNTGFGVVIPIERVIDIIEDTEVSEGMKAAIETSNRKSGVKSASAPLVIPNQEAAEGALLASGENPNHREDFMSLLNAAVKKNEPKD